MLPTLLLAVLAIAPAPATHPIIAQAYQAEQVYNHKLEEERKARELAEREQLRKEALQFELNRCPWHATTPDWLRREIIIATQTCRTRHLLSIMSYVESNHNPNAKNRMSSASGLFQYLDSTWRRWGCGNNKLDPGQQIRCTVKVIEAGGFKNNWLVWWSPVKQRLVPREYL